MLSLVVFAPNLVVVYAPDSQDTKDVKNFNEVLRNAFSIICALGLTQFPGSYIRGMLKDLYQVKKSAEVIQWILKFIYQMLHQSGLVDSKKEEESDHEKQH